MNSQTDLLAVRHNEAEQRFEMGRAPGLAVLTYHFQGDVVVFDHTFVPDHLRGGGVGAKLVWTGLEEAQRRGWKVVPECGYVAKYIQRHPEFEHLVK